MISDKPLENFRPKFDAVGCKLEYDGKILLLQRNRKGTGYQQWSSCVGKIEPNEEKEDAVVREVREETSLIIDKNNLKYIGKYYMRYKEFDFIFYLYQYTLTSEPKVKINSEHSAYKWLTLQDALKEDVVEDEAFCIKQAYNI
jgi:8-oxo-dGTP pyrophosphatase MutT (NUDIX family)